MEPTEYRLGIIGGSGLDEVRGVRMIDEYQIETPFGTPSDRVIHAGVSVPGASATMDVLFLARHGPGHHIPPHRINYRANIYALKVCGATHILAISAVGSLREEIAPGDFVVVDQLIDWTKRREVTFFDNIVAHVSPADPICPVLHNTLVDAARETSGRTVHTSGKLIVIDGPQYSTRAESELYRSWGIDIIGMTALPEAKLAREAELPYALLAITTDYDCWRAQSAAVTDKLVAIAIAEHAEAAWRTILLCVGRLPDLTKSPAHHCLDEAIAGNIAAIPIEERRKFCWLRPFATYIPPNRW